ncbi:MAG: SAM-dependent methyltransferase [Angustibacter sp.]
MNDTADESAAEPVTERPDWVPAEMDAAELNRPSGARVYDYFLGGFHNFAADRQLADAMARMTPDVGDTMRANRAFLGRVVRYFVAEGITQFLDIGSGIPTVGNVHEVAQQADPTARVVYVDVDPVAVAHSGTMLTDNPNAVVFQADARDDQAILSHPHLRQLLDLDRPVALLMLGVLHFIPDHDDPAGVVARLRRALPSGSYLALVNVTHENQPPEVIEAQRMSERTPTPIYLRSREQLHAQFDGLPLVDPGLVHLPAWRPDPDGPAPERPERFGALAGVARIP